MTPRPSRDEFTTRKNATNATTQSEVSVQPKMMAGLLENGGLTGSKQLRVLEKNLTAALRRARNLGIENGSPDDWNGIWCRRWDKVEVTVGRIVVQLRELEGFLAGSDSDQLRRALTSWETLRIEDAMLVDALGILSTQALALHPSSHQEWHSLTQTLETHMDTLHSCAQDLSVKLLAQTDKVAQPPLPSALKEQPKGTPANDTSLKYGELRDLGFLDVVQTMFRRMESPAKSASANRSPPTTKPKTSST